MFYSVNNGKISVKIKKFGAELSSFKSLGSGTEYLWQGNPDIWAGQSPILFPIVGTLLNDKYTYGGKEYTMFRHGIARKRDFDLKEEGENYIILTQKYDEETLKAYPFKYVFDIKFALDGKKLTVTHTIKNEGDGKMYFSAGAHPGFNCKICDVLEFECDESNAQNELIDEESILFDEHFPSPVNGKIFTVGEHIFDKDAHILSSLKSKKCTLKHLDGTADVEFYFGDVQFLGLWAKPGAPYVCIEPWYGINDSREKKDDFSQKRAIHKLESGEEFEFSYSAEIKE